MGVILAKFRKRKTTFQILEKLEEDITEAEALTISTREKQRRFIVNLYLVSIGLLVLGCLVYYFYFLPPIWSKRILYATPLVASSILVVCLGRLGSWFFQKRLNKNSSNLTKLREEKKKIIEEVMDKETYKVALEILNRFGDKTKPQSNTGGKKSFKPPANHSNNDHNIPKPFAAITHNQSPAVPFTIPNRNLIQQRNRTSQSPQINILDKSSLSSPLAVAAPNTPLSSNPSRAYVSPYTTKSALNYQLQYRTPVKTPFPIINQNEKKFFDKLLDFLIGDGQSSLYGMVCKECYGHNGMVSLEDYEYSAFRCAFCKVLNPAKKMRPKAPAIENIGSAIRTKSSTSSSEIDSGSELEDQEKSPMAVELSSCADSPQQPACDTDPVQCATDPVQCDTDPVQCDTDPVQCDTDPVQCDTDPVQCDTDPVQCDTDPVQCDTDPVQCDTGPVQCDSDETKASQSKEEKEDVEEKSTVDKKMD